MAGIGTQVRQGLVKTASDVPKGLAEASKQTVEGVLSAGTLGLDKIGEAGSRATEDPKMAEIKSREQRNKSIAASRIAQLQAELGSIAKKKESEKEQEKQYEERRQEQIKEAKENKRQNFLTQFLQRKTHGTGERTKQVG